MKIKMQIFKFIQEAYRKDSGQTDPAGSIRTPGKDSPDSHIIQELFDGMSTGTAQIIIEGEVSQTIAEQFSISQIENKGRYYLAKIIRSDGIPIQRLLVDKQTGSVRMVGR